MSAAPRPNAGHAPLSGFICPHCKGNFDSMFDLQDHFLKQHQDLQQAQKRPDGGPKKHPSKNQRRSQSPLPPPVSFSKFTLSGGIDEKLYASQRIGQSVNLTTSFRKMRHDFVASNTVKENRLLLRLEKLLKVVDLPAAGDARRQYEMGICEWVSDADVPLCPYCASRFSYLKLCFPHHCRLCGCIMCDECTLELSYQNVVKILNVCHIPSAMALLPEKVQQVQYIYKVCNYCNDSINAKYTSALIKETSDTGILNLYNDLKDCIEAFGVILPKYTDLVSRLHQGELSLDHILPANSMLEKLTKILSAVANICEQLDALPVRRVSERRLKAQIRVLGLRFYEEKRQLPTPPATKKYLQRQRGRIKAEKERRLRSTAKNRQKLDANDRKLDAFVPDISAGVPESHASGSTEGDPVQAQIMYVRNMLFQAEEQGRTEEVKLLRQNLEALQAFVDSNSQVSEIKSQRSDDTSSCVVNDALQEQIDYVEALIEQRVRTGEDVSTLQQNLQELRLAHSETKESLQSENEISRDSEYPEGKNPFG